MTEPSTPHTNWITIPDTVVGYPLDHFIIPSHYTTDLDSILIPNGLILDRVAKLAKDIARDSQSVPLTVICILKGGHTFFAHLLEHLKKETNTLGLNLPIQFDFVKVKSYVNDISTHDVKISFTQHELHSLASKHVLLVEDIVDTGKTMVALLKLINTANPASLKVVTLFKKRTPLSNGYVPDYVGFEIPDKFIVGYALDYNEYFRDLSHVCVISDSGKKKYSV